MVRNVGAPVIPGLKMTQPKIKSITKKDIRIVWIFVIIVSIPILNFCKEPLGFKIAGTMIERNGVKTTGIIESYESPAVRGRWYRIGKQSVIGYQYEIKVSFKDPKTNEKLVGYNIDKLIVNWLEKDGVLVVGSEVDILYYKINFLVFKRNYVIVSYYRDSISNQFRLTDRNQTIEMGNIIVAVVVIVFISAFAKGLQDMRNGKGRHAKRHKQQTEEPGM